MGQLTPDEARELLGVYALGALDDAERAEVEELVLADADARAELHTLQLGVAWLDHASTGAPRHVWRAIGDEIAAERVDAGDVAPASVVDLARRRRAPRLLAVAAALLVIVVVGVGLLVASRDDPAPSVAALAARTADRPGAQTVALRRDDGRAAARVVVADGRAYLVWSDRPAPIDGGTYQLWTLTPDGPRSAGLLGPAARDHVFAVGDDVTGIAVTREPRGGSPAPTGSPVAAAMIV
jgi:anti-sigma-K factor RskA